MNKIIFHQYHSIGNGLFCGLTLDKVITLFGFQYRIRIAKKVNEEPYVIVGTGIDRNKFTAYKLAKYDIQDKLIKFIINN